MAVSTAKAACFGYKAFQAFRLLMGDVTVVAEAVAELLAEGLGEAAIEAAVKASAEHVVSAYQNGEDLNKNALKFQAFCAQLSKELGFNNPAAKAVIDKAQQLYQVFVSIDTDSSGTVSRRELQKHCASLGFTTQVANEVFDSLDANKDGELSFEEFTKMLGPAAGRHEDPSTFDCKGRHGLKWYTRAASRPCDWCQAVIPPKCRIMVCIACGVDACQSCIATHMEHAASKITCKARHGLFQMKRAGVDSCSACSGAIHEGATMYSCRGSCPVYVCVGCVRIVPDDLYFTGLRHVR